MTFSNRFTATASAKVLKRSSCRSAGAPPPGRDLPLRLRPHREPGRSQHRARLAAACRCSLC